MNDGEAQKAVVQMQRVAAELSRTLQLMHKLTQSAQTAQKRLDGLLKKSAGEADAKTFHKIGALADEVIKLNDQGHKVNDRLALSNKALEVSVKLLLASAPKGRR